MSKNIYTFHYTYLIVNKNSQMKYIGVRSCSCLPENDDGYMGSSKLLDEAMNETPEYFTKTIIDTFPTREIANADEQRLHEMYDVARNSEFYNRMNAPSEFCMSGRTHSEETKQKMSDFNRGKTLSEETREKISTTMSGKNNHFYGKHHSEETRKKLSDVKRGRKHSLETRAKMRGENHHYYGKKRSAETCAKMSAATSGEKHYNYGKTRSAETREKISVATRGEKSFNYGKHPSAETRVKMKESHIGKKPSEETRAKMSSAQKGIPKAKITCPHCSKLGGISPMKRWHFDNCKKRHYELA